MKLPSALAGQRLDRAVAELLRAQGLEVSTREVRLALDEGRIRIDGRKSSPSGSAAPGSEIDVEAFVARARAEVAPEPTLLERVSILFEDEALLALAKPAGLPVAPLRPEERGTLLAAALAIAPEIATAGPPLEGGLGHRLDVETSGVVVFAKDPVTRAQIRSAFAAHQVEKRYLAMVSDPEGRWARGERTVTASLSGRGPKVRVLAPERGGLEAETLFTPTSAAVAGLRWVAARPRTGRRHQLRVHLAHLGTPIVSDPVYGTRHPEVPRLGLHAASLQLLGRPRIHAALAEDLRAASARLGLPIDGLEDALA